MTRSFLYLVLVLVILGSSLGLLAQNTDTNFVNSNIVYHQDARITALLLKSKVVNEVHPKVKGYRVQIFSVSGTSSKDKANKVKGDFLINHPQDLVYIVYQAPYFKVRIGNFRDIFDANAFLVSLLSVFPYAFVVEDEVVLPEPITSPLVIEGLTP